MNVENRTKIANFQTPRVFNAPDEGLPFEFGIGVRGPECFYDGAIRWSKKFSLRLVVLIQYRLWQTATQPPSQPATLP